ncbi:response regulator transcription factor [Chloroflexota bacterium]
MKVLIVEDDREIVEVVDLAFKIRWPEVKLLSTHLGEMGAQMVESENPDVVILDLGLPDISGFEVLKQIRLFSDVPILILTVRAEESDVVRGLEWGADDYMVKPFRQLELLSRIKALIRRRDSFDKEMSLVWGQLQFDPSTRQLHQGEREVNLTRTEGSILYHLMKNAGKVVPYHRLAESVWGDDYPDATENLRVYIRRLREKIEADPGNPKIILNMASVGYLLPKPD